MGQLFVVSCICTHWHLVGPSGPRREVCTHVQVWPRRSQGACSTGRLRRHSTPPLAPHQTSQTTTSTRDKGKLAAFCGDLGTLRRSNAHLHNHLTWIAFFGMDVFTVWGSAPFHSDPPLTPPSPSPSASPSYPFLSPAVPSRRGPPLRHPSWPPPLNAVLVTARRRPP